jgi:hypothetical protein
VLRRVNHRRFSAELGLSLAGSAFVSTIGELERVLSSGAEWLLKRPFGFAGRGRRRLSPGPRSPADRAWIEASLESGEGLMVEPWVERLLDAGLHGHLAPDGALRLGHPTVQEIAPDGSWRSTSIAPPGALTPPESERLVEEATKTGAALHAAGYFGPFGIDAFRYRAGGGAAFQPRSEINARYSMGWAVGMVDFDLEGS